MRVQGIHVCAAAECHLKMNGSHGEIWIEMAPQRGTKNKDVSGTGRSSPLVTRGSLARPIPFLRSLLYSEVQREDRRCG